MTTASEGRGVTKLLAKIKENLEEKRFYEGESLKKIDKIIYDRFP